MDDFIRAPVRSGSSLIRQIGTDASATSANVALEAGFMSWNRIRILRKPQAGSGRHTGAFHSPAFRLVLNQAYHPQWRSSACMLERGHEGNLVAACPSEAMEAGPVDLVFFDPVSDLGARVSVMAGVVLAIAIGLLQSWRLVSRRRPLGVPSPVR
jgi:hypothetical protein